MTLLVSNLQERDQLEDLQIIGKILKFILGDIIKGLNSNR